MQVEDKSQEVFDIAVSGYFALSDDNAFDDELVEIITMLRIIDKIGFLKKTGKNVNTVDFTDPVYISDELLYKVKEQKTFLIKTINEALEKMW